MKTLLSLAFVLLSHAAFAQSVQVEYDLPLATGLVTAQSWTPILYVNNTRFPQPSHTCVAATFITCRFPMPDIAMALTPSGPQTFEVSLNDVVLGEGPRSAPLTRIRPVAPTVLRFFLQP